MYIKGNKETEKEKRYKAAKKPIANNQKTTLEPNNSETIITDSIYIIPHLWKKVNKTDFCFFT